MIKDPPQVAIPINLLFSAKYKRFLTAEIYKLDHDRIGVIDFLLANLYKIFL